MKPPPPVTTSGTPRSAAAISTSSCFIFIPGDADADLVPVAVLAEVPFLEHSLLPEAALLQVQAQRGVVVLDDRGLDAVKAELFEGVAQDGAYGVVSVALAAVLGRADEQPVKGVAVLPV